MIGVYELYQMWARDDANKDENGYASFDRYNRYLKRAQISLLKDITGLINGEPSMYPRAYETQKVKDYLKRFIVPYKAHNSFEIPKDYYLYDNIFKLGSRRSADCETGAITFQHGCDIPIEIVDGQQFNDRCNSSIRGMKPTINNPICKIVNNKFVFMPNDVGSSCLEYIRYPKEAYIVTKLDPVKNIPVVDLDKSVDIEYDDWAIEPLLFFMNDKWALHTRERAFKEFNSTNKQPTT